MNRIAPYYPSQSNEFRNRFLRERNTLGMAVPDQPPVDGQSPTADCAATTPAAPSPAYFARTWLETCRRIAVATARATLECAALLAMIGLAIVARWARHGLWCECDRCACPDCRESRFLCRCGRGQE